MWFGPGMVVETDIRRCMGYILKVVSTEHVEGLDVEETERHESNMILRYLVEH